MFIRLKKRDDKIYLQVVESRREGPKVRQIVHMTIGRLDILKKTGRLDSLLRSGLRFSDRLAVLDAHSKGDCLETSTRRIGAVLLFERLWERFGIKQILSGLTSGRRFRFSLERAIFITVLHRLVSPGSDRACERWMGDYKIAGMEKLSLHQFYRAMGFLGEPVKGKDKETRQYGKTEAPRCNKDIVEEAFFASRRDLFTDMDLVFFDTTSIHFEGEGGESLGQHGHSKSHRPDLKQMVVGMVLDSDGNPVCSELLPGNTSDMKTLIPVARRLKERFGISRVCIVADRGMISQDTMKRIAALGWQYILGVRMRKCTEVKEEVLTRGGRFQEVYAKRRQSKDPSPLKVKEVKVGDCRYVVCHNEEQATKDRHDREAIIASLKEKLKQGDKTLVGNKGYKRYLKTVRAGHFEIDETRVKSASRFDGKWVLTTNTQLTAVELALKYKQLWMVEDIFRTMKSILSTRPIYHKCDDTIRGHVFCSFLALVLRKNLQDLIAEKGWQLEWADIVEDVDKLQEMELLFENKTFILRTEVKGCAGKVFQAANIPLPPVLKEKKCGTTPVPTL